MITTIVIVVITGRMMKSRFIGGLNRYRNCGDAEVLALAPLSVFFRFECALNQLRLLLLPRLGRRHQRTLWPIQYHKFIPRFCNHRNLRTLIDWIRNWRFLRESLDWEWLLGLWCGHTASRVDRRPEAIQFRYAAMEAWIQWNAEALWMCGTRPLPSVAKPGTSTAKVPEIYFGFSSNQSGDFEEPLLNTYITPYLSLYLYLLR